MTKTCPHCDSPLAPDDLVCPACGKPYWQPDNPPPVDMADNNEETLGCFSILLWPLLISLGVTTVLILSGFIFHVFVNFEEGGYSR